MKPHIYKQLKVSPLFQLLFCILGMTLDVHAQSPGGVSSGLQTWLKADAITGAGDGSVLSTWTSSVGSFSVSQATTSQKPVFYNNTAAQLVNFNPSVVFSRTAGSTMTTTTQNILGYTPSSTNTPFHFIAVAKDAESSFTRTESGQYNLRGIFGNGVSGNNPAMDLQKDGAAENGWNPWSDGTGEYNGGKATIYNGGGTGNGTMNLPIAYTNQLNHKQAQIFGLGYTFGTGNKINSTVDGWSEVTNLDEDGLESYIRANYFSLGQSGGSEWWTGPINEILAYNRELSATELQRVNTYLAIKYGTTLGQGSNAVGKNANTAAYPMSLTTGGYDYILSDGTTTIWNTSTNSGYNFDIAAIGRDDGSGLTQKQSKSVNYGFQPTLNIGTLAVSNAANTGSFADDKSFEAWGNNGLTSSFSVNYAPNTFTPTVMGAFYRMGRIWKVQETGIVGTITVSVPASSKAERLLVSSDGAFAPGSTQEILLTADGNGNLSATIDFATGDYFTFGAVVVVPGAVIANLKAWYKANAGVTGTSSVTTWADQYNSYDVIQNVAAHQPSLAAASAAFNYNPSLSFTNTDQLEYKAGRFMNTTDSGTMFGAASNSLDGGYENLGDLGIDNPHMGTLDNQQIMWMNTSTPVRIDHPTVLTKDKTHLLGYFWNGGSPNVGSGVRQDGVEFYESNTEATGVGNSGVVDGMWTIGGYEYVENWHGNIAEIVLYDRNLTITEKERVETYMAIKYGTTLSHNYLSANGVTVYDVSTYGNNVAGIARDDAQALNQKQSKSVNTGSILTVGLGAVVVNDQSTIAANFSADKSFEVIGDNDLGTNYGTVYAPNSYTPTRGFYRMNRIWKIQETGVVGQVTISIPGSGDVYLLTKTANDNFSTSTGVTEIKMIPDGNGNLMAQVDFSNGQYFTFGSELIAPGCVANGLAVWLKADAGTSTVTDGVDVEGWLDASGNGRTHTAASGAAISLGKPTFKVNSGFNFNPSLVFSATGQGDGLVTPAFASAKEAVHVFAMSRVGDNGWRSTYSFRRDGTHSQWLSSVPSVWIAGNHSTTTNNGVLYGVTSHILNKTAADNQQIWWNGSQFTFTGNKGYAYSDSWGSNRMYVGNDAYYDGTNYLGSEVFDGEIMEIAIYKTGTPSVEGGPMADADIKKIQSYFGIKYGVTLAHEYFSGAGITVWNSADATFHKNVAGIARDDCQGLNQKQARSYTSAEMTVAIDTIISTTNAANPGAFDNDKAFLMFGDNNGTGVAVLTNSSCNPPMVDKATNKIWKFVESGSVEAVKLSVDLSFSGFNTSYPVFMQVASDASFSTIITSVPMVQNGVNFEALYDFNGTRYIRFLGNTTPPPNTCTDDKIYRWNTPFWTWGTTNRTTNFADGQNINVRIQGNGLYAPTVYPVSEGWWEHIFIPRYDKLSDNNKITTRIGMAKVASTVSFEVFDLDEYYGKDVVTVIGKLGAVMVSPKITFPQYTALTKTGNTVSATTGVWDISQRGRFYVNFDSPIDSVIIEYTRGSSPFSFNFPTYQDIRIENLNITCIPPTPKAPTADNIYIYKEVSTANPKVDEDFTYKFTIQNYASCDTARVIDFIDVLPTGLVWVDSTLATDLPLTGLNAYDAGQTLSFSATVPGGTSYMYIKAKGNTTGLFPGQADFTVNREVGVSPLYKSDDPHQSGAQDPTPVTINANKPIADLVLTKSANKTTAGANEDIVYTYSIKNNGSAAVTTDFQDNLPCNSGGSITYTGAYTAVPGAPSSIATSPLAGNSSVLIRNITVGAGGTVTFTLTANTGTFTLGNVATNIASITPDDNYRRNPVKSNAVNVTVIASLDTDGDGTPDATDTDDDNDGLTDTTDKFPLDTDNDGTPNATDMDDDGDGILDTAEASGKALDTDNDGTPNATDTDDDNDGIPDSTEQGTLDGNGKYTLPDTDGDGLPDLVDPLDTDGDGTPDATDTDDDGDGILDTQDPKPLDTDNDGTNNDVDTDDDGDGILDTAEASGKALDTDNDGTPNATDTDDDNDGIPDITEQGTLDGSGKYTLPDTDGDGTPDLVDPLDTDGDDTPDATDTDDDNDGLTDTTDKFPLDTDNDGTPNATDTDDDGDGILDTAEASGKALDTDNDGTPNATDTDDDNDGILDSAEIGVLDGNGKYTLPDTDGDGTPDLVDPLDTDGDGTPDTADTDDDGDGILDTQDPKPLDTDNDGTPNATDTDDDGDGILDTAEASGKALDTDNDGTPNATDTDDDNDGIPDSTEQGTLDGNGKYTLPDTDGDSLPDLVDPLDTDGDGTPDATDTDDDNDGLTDTTDKFPLDTDNDGTPNATDTDDDGDGILDTAEASGKALDTDNDGTPNATDTDDDNDGIPDSTEQGTLDGNGKYTLPDTDGDGTPDLVDPLDTDGDGTPNATDTDDDNDGLTDTTDKFPLDTDNDGTPNATDTDDDGDGILDTAEASGKALDTDNDGTPNATDTDDDNDGIPDSTEQGTLDGNGKYTLPDTDGDGTPDLVDSVNSSVCVTLNLKVLLEGPYDSSTGKMSTMLNQRGLLPGQTHIGPFGVDTPAGQPYTVAPWNYNGTEGKPSVTYASTVVDWVLVSLRTDSLLTTSTVLRKAALLHDDGHITFTDACYNLPTGTYFVVVEHRNHMGVMSGRVKVQSTTLNFDFTQQDSYIIVNPPSFGQIQANGKWMMHAGDGKKDTFTDNYDINFNDSQLWKNESGFFDRYLYGDFNMDADVNFLDSVIWKKNNGRYSVVPR